MALASYVTSRRLSRVRGWGVGIGSRHLRVVRQGASGCLGAAKGRFAGTYLCPCVQHHHRGEGGGGGCRGVGRVEVRCKRERLERVRREGRYHRPSPINLGTREWGLRTPKYFIAGVVTWSGFRAYIITEA